jgi:protein-tyrosine phosphatase
MPKITMPSSMTNCTLGSKSLLAAARHLVISSLPLFSLSAAESPQLLTRLGITHVLSACPDYLATAETLKHLTLPLMDDEDFDILEHLPTTCRVIKEALDGGGKVFCHCVMGISRSATVVCAYRTRVPRTKSLC